MEINQISHCDDAINQICQVPGIRFAALINQRGRKITGGFSNSVTPLEKDEQKMAMLFMEMSLDLSMRREFDNSLGNINAIVSYRDKVILIVVPYSEDFILLSLELELDPLKVIQIVRQHLLPNSRSMETCMKFTRPPNT